MTSRSARAALLGTATLLAVAAANCAFPEFPFGAVAFDAGAGDSGAIAMDATDVDGRQTGAVDATSDASGSCANDCLGGACIAGACQPVVLYSDADGGPGGIYVTDLGDTFFTQYYGGRIVRSLVDGGTSFASENLVNPVRIAGSSKGTFATVFAGGDASAGAQIVTVNVSGGEKRIVAGPLVGGLAIAPWGIVVAGQRIVWTNALEGGSVMMASLNGDAPTLLAVGGRPQEIVANAQYAWFIDADHSSLFRVPLASDAGAAVRATPDFVDYIAYSAGRLYTASAFTTSSIGVLDDPTSTGAPVREIVSRYVMLASSGEPAVNVPHGLAVDDTYLYWVNSPSVGATGSLVRARIDGSAAPELLAAHLPQPDQITVTAKAIYWTSFTGTIQRLAKP